MMPMSFDSDGLIIQTDGDGGDCSARTGEYYTLLAIRERMGISNAEWPRSSLKDWDEAGIKLFTAGVPLRYTQPPYNDPKDVSRDQLLPMIIASGYYQQQWYAAALASVIESHNSFCPNGDLCGPVDWVIINRARAKRAWFYFGDLQLMFSVLLRCWKARDPDDVGDDINLTLYLLCATDFWPTVFSRFAMYLYRKLRPRGVQYAFDHYHRPETHSNPLNELARPVISARLSRNN